MSKERGKSAEKKEGSLGLGGFLSGLGSLVEKLGELAEKGEEISKSGEIHSSGGKVKGMYGFNIKVGLGEKDIKVEPFGNVHKDKQTGDIVVTEVREPMVDVFEEKDHVLVVAEMPGVSEEDVQLDLKDDILSIAAEKGDKKYRKEVLLPGTFSSDKVSHSCRNGVLEIKLPK